MSKERKYIDIKEFVADGYLQELNRQFLHPLGLALEVKRDRKTGEMAIGGVWDSRDDSEGFVFSGIDLYPKAVAIAMLANQRKADRIQKIGSWVQTAEPA